MRQIWGWAIALLCFGLGLGLAVYAGAERPGLLTRSTDPGLEVQALSGAVKEAPASPSYEVRAEEWATIHILRVPLGWAMVPRVSPMLQPLVDFAQESGAIAALNGGYFDPVNQQTTSFVTQNRELVADPRTNDRLMANPDLAPYLSQILNRSELRRYQCGSDWRYGIAAHADPVPPSCELIDALGAGPRLLPQITAQAEGFVAEEGGIVIRDAIGTTTPNARTAVGITAAGDLIGVLVAQRLDRPEATGLTLAEVAEVLQSLGAVEALNLDGGSSSGLVYDGTEIYGKGDGESHAMARPVKSVLVVQRLTDL